MADNNFDGFFFNTRETETKIPPAQEIRETKPKVKKKSYTFKPRVAASVKNRIYTVGRINVFLAFLVSMLLAVIYGIALSEGIYDSLPSKDLKYILHSVSSLIIFLAPAMVFCKLAGKGGFKLLGFARFSSSVMGYVIICTLLLILVVASEEFSLAYFFSITGKSISENLFASENKLWIIIAYAVVPAICEELLFRGVLQTELSKIAGGFTGIFASSLAYAVIKLDFEYFFVYLTTGLILAFVMHITNSIYPCIFMHAVNSLFSLGFSAQLNFIASERAGNLFVIIILTICVFVVLLFSLKMLETICIRKAAAIDISKNDGAYEEQEEKSVFRFYSKPFKLSSDSGYSLHKFLRVIFSPALIVSVIVFLFYTIV